MKRWFIEYAILTVNGHAYESTYRPTAKITPLELRAPSIREALDEAEEYLKEKYKEDPEISYWKITGMGILDDKLF